MLLFKVITLMSTPKCVCVSIFISLNEMSECHLVCEQDWFLSCNVTIQCDYFIISCVVFFFLFLFKFCLHRTFKLKTRSEKAAFYVSCAIELIGKYYVFVVCPFLSFILFFFHSVFLSFFFFPLVAHFQMIEIYLYISLCVHEGSVFGVVLKLLLFAAHKTCDRTVI